MKKLMSFVLAAVLCFGMSTTVLAAPSPSVNSPVVDNTQAIPDGSTEINGVTVKLEVKSIAEAKAEMTAEQQTAIDKVLTVVNSGNATVIADMQKALIKEVAKEDAAVIKYSKLVDVALPEGQEIPAGGIQIKITDAAVKAGMKMVMLHMKADGQWENIPVTVVDGGIVGTFTSLSPVYYFEIQSSGSAAPSYSFSSNTSAEEDFNAADGTPMRWLTSKENGNISISGKQASIPEGAEFSAKVVSDAEYEAIASAVAKAKGSVSFAAYNFSLSDADGNAITKFSGHADVSMPIPAGLDVPEGNTVTVYYYNNGKLQKCNTVVADGFVTFGTTHFSTFVYVSETPASAAASSVVSPKTADNSMALYMVMLAMAAFGGMIYTTRKVR